MTPSSASWRRPLRAALAGRAVTPSVFDMMLVIGRDETLAR
jgi:glutamyl-tRNA synthetase